MGFGYLFIGYLFFFNIAFDAYTDIFAVALMLIGLSTLQKYAKGFKQAFGIGILLAVAAFLSFAARLSALLKLFVLPEAPSDLLTLVLLILKAVFLWYVLTGITQISKETDIPVLRARAIRNKILTLLFYGVAILARMPIWTSVPTLAKVIFAFYLLFGLVYAFFNAKTFFECYIWICLEGDEGMERKRSRFGLVNKLNDISDRLDEKTLERKKTEQLEKQERKKQKQGKKRK